jgi:hypothetical protein
VARVNLSAGSTVVREWQEADAEAFALQANDRRVWLGMRDAFPYPCSIEVARRFIGMARAVKNGQILDQSMYAILRDDR